MAWSVTRIRLPTPEMRALGASVRVRPSPPKSWLLFGSSTPAASTRPETSASAASGHAVVAGHRAPGRYGAHVGRAGIHHKQVPGTGLARVAQFGEARGLVGSPGSLEGRGTRAQGPGSHRVHEQRVLDFASPLKLRRLRPASRTRGPHPGAGPPPPTARHGTIAAPNLLLRQVRARWSVFAFYCRRTGAGTGSIFTGRVATRCFVAACAGTRAGPARPPTRCFQPIIRSFCLFQ